jgi:hypothetical protein
MVGKQTAIDRYPKIITTLTLPAQTGASHKCSSGVTHLLVNSRTNKLLLRNMTFLHIAELAVKYALHKRPTKHSSSGLDPVKRLVVGRSRNSWPKDSIKI